MSRSRILLSGASVHNRQQAFRMGMRWAFDAPIWVLFAGMLGIGALGKSQGFSDVYMVASSFFVFAQPGQIVLMEMLLTGAAAVPIALAVGLTSARFFAMGVSLFPLFHRHHRNWRIVPAAHTLSMTTWALCMRAFDGMPRRLRWYFYLGVCIPCFLISLPGTWLGFHLAGRVPEAITLTLVMLNPLFFVMTFADIKLPINRWAAGFGALLMPLFNQWDAGTSLLLTAVVGGTLAYGIQRWRDRRQEQAEPHP
ncbi:MAG: AzlC family ABC transporter permease [Alphaproteobacteria bacterium]|nr:AzlC family ABC transporter permease [Alphaproteobacteria bacterium]